MNIYFIFFACVFAMAALVIYIINNSKRAVSLGIACFSFVLLSAGMLLGVVFEKDITDNYREVTTSSFNQKQNGRPVKRQTAKSPETTASVDTDSIVYITKSGSKYHLSLSCGNNEYYECTLEQALSRNLTPCKNCAQ